MPHSKTFLTTFEIYNYTLETERFRINRLYQILIILTITNSKNIFPQLHPLLSPPYPTTPLYPTFPPPACHYPASGKRSNRSINLYSSVRRYANGERRQSEMDAYFQGRFYLTEYSKTRGNRARMHDLARCGTDAA